MITMPHPFEIKASDSTDTPDELMITWGDVPQGSIGSIYLPAVAASDIISLADKILVMHRLSVTDPHTVQFPCGNATVIPIPQGTGRYTGLLSIDLAQADAGGGVYTVAVRQFTRVSATVTPPPPPAQIQSPTRAGAAAGAGHPAASKAKKATPAVQTAPPDQSFSWKQLRGAFQYTLNATAAAPGALLYPEERLLAWLKWRIGVTPPTTSWLPVLQRYLTLIEGRVIKFGGDPGAIGPSQAGDVPGRHRPPGPGDKDELAEIVGKIVAIHYDRFGDFRGFTILTEHARRHRFRAAEQEMEELVRRAWMERTVVSVLVPEHDREWPITITLHRYH